MSSQKFLICTMYCGEPDLPHMIKAISEQGVEVDHRIFSYMTEIDAHNAVYQTFNNADRSWIRAKIDADVVLNPRALAHLRIGSNQWLDPQTHDYFSDVDVHAGVAFFGPDVTFRVQTNTLKCDRDVARNANHVTMGLIGRHAHYSSQLTAFHFGFHRGLKSQLPIFESVQKAYDRHHDRVRLMALRGFELGQSDRYKEWHLGHAPPPSDHNYGPVLDSLFEEFSVDEPPVLLRTWR